MYSLKWFSVAKMTKNETTRLINLCVQHTLSWLIIIFKSKTRTGTSAEPIDHGRRVARLENFIQKVTWMINSHDEQRFIVKKFSENISTKPQIIFKKGIKTTVYVCVRNCYDSKNVPCDNLPEKNYLCSNACASCVTARFSLLLVQYFWFWIFKKISRRLFCLVSYAVGGLIAIVYWLICLCRGRTYC